MAKHFPQNVMSSWVAVQNSLEEIILFHLDEKEGLTQRILRPNEDWESRQLISTGISNFAATCGLDDYFYLVDISNTGIITCRQKIKNEYYEYRVFQAEKEKSFNNFQLQIDSQGRIHLVYLVEDVVSKQWWFMHHYFEQGEWSAPIVIDFGGKGGSNYGCTLLDRHNNLHIVYHLREKTGIALYHRTFSPQKGFGWSRADFITRNTDNSYPFIIESLDQYLHLVWNACTETGHTVKHSKKAIIEEKTGFLTRAKWTQPLDISPPASEEQFPFIEFNNDFITVKWNLGDSIYWRSASLQGSSWSEIYNFTYQQGVKLLQLIKPARNGGVTCKHWIPITGTNEISIEKDLKSFANHLGNNPSHLSPENSQSKQQEGSKKQDKNTPKSQNPSPEKTSKSSSLPSNQSYSYNITTSTLNHMTTSQRNHSPVYKKKQAPPKGNKTQNPRHVEKTKHDYSDNLSKKHEASKKAWEEDNLRLLKENQNLKREIESLNKKKENDE